MEDKSRRGVGDVNRIGAFQRHVDALVADQADLFRAGHDRLNRRRGGEIGKAVLQSVFGEEAQILSDPRRRHGAAEGVVNAAQRRRVCGVQLARERETSERDQRHAERPSGARCAILHSCLPKNCRPMQRRG